MQGASAVYRTQWLVGELAALGEAMKPLRRSLLASTAKLLPQREAHLREVVRRIAGIQGANEQRI